jgi:pyruvate/2-oxoglutarate/acetoin dehydrogenase E1 component|tara:strand:+ start:3617 stop:4147 length:531 start_codon:yes stop_codon:yes gene_type:complete
MENTIYKDELTKSMNYLASKDDTIFVGQQIVYRGNPMSTTVEEIPKEKMIETPVFEDVQMGMSIGLGITNTCVVSFYPRWDFLIIASNQLVNHLDKFKHMTNQDSHVIIRVGKGSDKPLDPGHQHRADYTESFKQILDNIEIVNFHTHENIYETYVRAYENKKPIILVEYPEKYYA